MIVIGIILETMSDSHNLQFSVSPQADFVSKSMFVDCDKLLYHNLSQLNDKIPPINVIFSLRSDLIEDFDINAYYKFASSISNHDICIHITVQQKMSDKQTKYIGELLKKFNFCSDYSHAQCQPVILSKSVTYYTYLTPQGYEILKLCQQLDSNTSAKELVEKLPCTSITIKGEHDMNIDYFLVYTTIETEPVLNGEMIIQLCIGECDLKPNLSHILYLLQEINT